MSAMTPGAALRQLEQAHSGLKKARQVLRLARSGAGGLPARQEALRIGWDRLSQAHRLLATIPLDAATEPVMTKQLAVERYATALLVSLRMLSTGPEPPGTAFWEQRIDRAISLRNGLLDLDSATNAYRVVHAEGDGLSSLVVDRFADVLSVEVFSLAIYQRIGPILDIL